MNDKNFLLGNIEKLHTTERGINRIKNNLKLEIENVVEYCKKIIKNPNCRIYRQGKNFYCEYENILLTINAKSYTIITAHIF